MSSVDASLRVAVIGTGIAGASCARALSLAGCAVHVFDKSRGPGGRLATRRVEWTDRHGHRRLSHFDHGSPGCAAHQADFRQFVAAATQAGVLAPWSPTLAPGSRPRDDAGPLHLPLPDMPALCRWLLRDVAATWSCTVDRLHRGAQGWQIEAAGSSLAGHFDAVVLALPPAQAAPLLAEHRRDWAQRASLALMQPCWTLMGVTDRSPRDMDWDIGRPQQGLLSWVMRQDGRPGREAAPDEAHWVAHARAGWSREHLEEPPAWVQARMQDALQDWLGRPLVWQHAVVHRWRYAKPMSSGAAAIRQCWWDAARGLGVCGDFLGGNGVEGAWLSAQALIDGLLSGAAARTAPSLSPLIHHRGHEAPSHRAETRVTP